MLDFMAIFTTSMVDFLAHILSNTETVFYSISMKPLLYNIMGDFMTVPAVISWSPQPHPHCGYHIGYLGKASSSDLPQSS